MFAKKAKMSPFLNKREMKMDEDHFPIFRNTFTIGILHPYPSQSRKRPPPGYHPFPFCYGDYSKYCLNPWACPVGAVWLKEDAFRNLHFGIGEDVWQTESIGQNLASFISNDLLHGQMESRLVGRKNRAGDFQVSDFDNSDDNPGLRPITKTYYSLSSRGQASNLGLSELPKAITKKKAATSHASQQPVLNKTRNPDAEISRYDRKSLKGSIVGFNMPWIHSDNQANGKENEFPISSVPRYFVWHNTFAPKGETNSSFACKPTEGLGASFKWTRCKWGNCELGFPSQMEALEHIKRVHIGSRKQIHFDFTCRIRDCPCRGKVFEKRDNIVSHVTNVGFDIRYALCPYREYGCTVALKREWDLPRHAKSCKFNPGRF